MKMLVDILEYAHSMVTCSLCDAYGKMWYFKVNASSIKSEKIKSLPATGYIHGEKVSEYGDVVGFSTKHSQGIKSTEGTDLFYVLTSQLAE